MKQKPLTKAIATMLAEKVRQKLAETTIQLGTELKAKAEASKEFKEYVKLTDQLNEIRAKMDALKNSINTKWSTPIANVYLSTHYAGGPRMDVRENNAARIDNIRDMLLLEDYFNGSTTTPEEMVDVVVKKLLTTKK